MELWVILSVAAAAAQTLRFGLQKALATGGLSATAATWSRFLWSAPVITVAVAFHLVSTGQNLPQLSGAFWLYALSGGVFQILATVCTVALFQQRAFSVGITFKKTEVMLTALVGFVILGDAIPWAGAVAIAAGFAGVLLLSKPPEGGGIFNRGAALGLISGVFFALSAVTYRGATLELQSADLFTTAGLTLSVVTIWQTLALGLWLLLREPGQISETIRLWRTSSLIGVFSLIGSACWFAAFALQNAAYVFAVGQVELIFSLILGRLVFGERPARRELVGMTVLTGSIVAVALIG